MIFNSQNLQKLLYVLKEQSQNPLLKIVASKFCAFLSYSDLHYDKGHTHDLSTAELSFITKRSNLSPSEHFSVAMRAIYRKKYAEAKSRLEYCINDGCHNPELILAYILLTIEQDTNTKNIGEYVTYLDKYQQFVKDAEGAVLCFFYFLKAEVALYFGNLDFAIKYYRRAAFLTDDPQKIFVAMKDLYCRLGMGRVEKFYDKKVLSLNLKIAA